MREIMAALNQYSRDVRPLPGIAQPAARQTLAMQYIASLRREDYFRLLQRKIMSPDRADPIKPVFQAERAVAYHLQQGNVDEGAWLIFLMTHFARHVDTGWLRLNDVYGMLGCGVWNWAAISQNPASFSSWMSSNWTRIRGHFGSHRKYESLRPTALRNIGSVVNSYVDWVGPDGHRQLFSVVTRRAGNHPEAIFDYLYCHMQVNSFGRLAKFDYLAMLGRYGIIPAVPGSAYLKGATGPLRGARLLFDGHHDGVTSPDQLQAFLNQLDDNISAGMVVTEDALCNWQKSPLEFRHFKG